jgi:holin-like protein
MKLLERLPAQLLQTPLFVAAWLVLDRLVHRLSLPVPAGVIGLFIVTALLLSGRVALHRIESGARWLLAEMPLFFIPPMLAITGFGPVFESHGPGLLAAILIGSAAVMAGTGLVVDRMFHFESQRRERAAAGGKAQP